VTVSDVQLELDTSDARALAQLAEDLGRLAADLWLDGKLQLTADDRREIVAAA
jgi:hypothetical protein